MKINKHNQQVFQIRMGRDCVPPGGGGGVGEGVFGVVLSCIHAYKNFGAEIIAKSYWLLCLGSRDGRKHFHIALTSCRNLFPGRLFITSDFFIRTLLHYNIIQRFFLNNSSRVAVIETWNC